MRHHQLTKRAGHCIMAAAVCAAFATSASAQRYPSPKNRYMSKALKVCDQGVFYVGGAPKVTPHGSNSTTNTTYEQIIIGSMFVQFQIPMKSRAWPVIMVHGSGYNGSCVQGTAGGTEGWMDYTVRHGIPTYVVDQAGRARSGFDKSVINEADYYIDKDPVYAKALLPSLGGSTSTAWTSWFGHIVPTGTDITTGQMVRHGAPARQSDGSPAPGQDPLCLTEPAHCAQLGRIPMEPEAPWAVDQDVASRQGKGAPAGLGTVRPDIAGHVNPAFPQNDRYLALQAYKFNVPNTEATLPGSICPTCVPPAVNSVNTWTPRALAQLVEGIGGAVVATHSQSGTIGHHMARILKEHGNLDLLKGLITIEGSCSLTGAGLEADGSDFRNIPYLAFKGDYSATSAQCQSTVDAIKAAGGKADYIQLDQAGPWQGRYTGPYGPGYVGPFAGVSHMMMIESSNLQVMDVILDWSSKNIANPKAIACNAKFDDES
jgi:hypothetical protein